MVKLCKDCKWCKKPGPLARCCSPKNVINRVDRTGFNTTERKYDYCETQRMDLLGGWLFCRLDGSCGKEGRWWEPVQ